MNSAEIILLVVLCLAFSVAIGIIVYNAVKGKSCCGDCDGCAGCHAEKKGGAYCDGHCERCAANVCKINASEDKDKAK